MQEQCSHKNSSQTENSNFIEFYNCVHLNFQILNELIIIKHSLSSSENHYKPIFFQTFEVLNIETNLVCLYRSKTVCGEGTSLVVWWLRIHHPMQGTWIRSLLGELRSHMPGAHALQLEKPPLEKATCHSKDPEQPKIKKQTVNCTLHFCPSTSLL